MKARFVLGVDLGQAHDYTALVVLERVRTELHARHLERLALGTSYPSQVERVVDLVTSPEMARDALVAVDGTGVGRAVTDLLRVALKPLQTPLVSITITAGSASSRVGSRWSAPKRDLIAAAQVALQTKSLKIAAALPTAQVLVDELSAYRVRISEEGHDSYGTAARPRMTTWCWPPPSPSTSPPGGLGREWCTLAWSKDSHRRILVSPTS